MRKLILGLGLVAFGAGLAPEPAAAKQPQGIVAAPGVVLVDDRGRGRGRDRGYYYGAPGYWYGPPGHYRPPPPPRYYYTPPPRVYYAPPPRAYYAPPRYYYPPPPPPGVGLYFRF
jgi:hypothetical protein